MSIPFEDPEQLNYAVKYTKYNMQNIVMKKVEFGDF